METARSYDKVFCLGWLKTGTTSFGHAMERLGFRHASWDPKVWRWYLEGDLERILAYAADFDSFDDLPWNKVDLLPRLDEAFPRSRFVLLERTPSSWYRSSAEHNRRLGEPVRRQGAAIRWFRGRSRRIRKRFRRQPERLLVMDLEAGDGYETLCPFLELEVLEEEFPHLNATAGRPAGETPTPLR